MEIHAKKPEGFWGPSGAPSILPVFSGSSRDAVPRICPSAAPTQPRLCSAAAIPARVPLGSTFVDRAGPRGMFAPLPGCPLRRIVQSPCQQSPGSCRQSLLPPHRQPILADIATKLRATHQGHSWSPRPLRVYCEFIHGGCRHSARNDTACHCDERSEVLSLARGAIPNYVRGDRLADTHGERTRVISSRHGRGSLQCAGPGSGVAPCRVPPSVPHRP